MRTRDDAQPALAVDAKAGARFTLGALVLLVLAACTGTGDVTDEPPPTATATPAATPAAEEALTERVEGDGPAFDEERETGVLTVMTGIDTPERVAVSANGTRVVVTAEGRIFQHGGDEVTSLGRLTEGARLRGLALPPDYPETPTVYMLLERDEQVEVHRLVLEAGTLTADEVIAEAGVDDVRWNGNGLATGTDGALYAAIGGGDSSVAFELDALVRGEVVDAPCSPWRSASDVELGPWVAVDDAGEASGSAVGAPLWTVDGAVAVAVYRSERIPQWWGSLFVVTEDGDVVRVPADEDGCLDFAEREVLFDDRYGRVRDVATGADGDLYVVTGNGLAGAHPDDDRVLRVGPVHNLGLLFPDLRTQPPANLTLARAWIDGEQRSVLRFTNTVMNLGDGPLEVRDYGEGYAVQRVYTANGVYLERPAGELVWHWSHAHFHFDNFNRFELWEQDAYERMQDGDEQAEPEWVHDKVSMCLMDLVPVVDEPAHGDYGRECVQGAQGISPGWGDVYFFDIDEQWVVLDGDFRDGDYVLRSIVDSENLFHESPGGADPDRESHEANGAATWFTISGGAITVTHTESGAGDEWAR